MHSVEWLGRTTMAIETKYTCDTCPAVNGEMQEFRNEVLLVKDGKATEMRVRICKSCYEEIESYFKIKRENKANQKT
jgi:hypothetical protein